MRSQFTFSFDLFFFFFFSFSFLLSCELLLPPLLSLSLLLPLLLPDSVLSLLSSEVVDCDELVLELSFLAFFPVSFFLSCPPPDSFPLFLLVFSRTSFALPLFSPRSSSSLPFLFGLLASLLACSGFCTVCSSSSSSLLVLLFSCPASRSKIN